MAKGKKKIKVCTIGDMHHNLDFEIDPCDLLLIAGDLCPAYHNAYLSIDLQASWLQKDFTSWLCGQPVKECVAIFGNHDWIGEIARHRIPIMPDNFRYIQDESIKLFGLKIYGTAWSLPFNNWAFSLPEKRLKIYWDNIPDTTDILLCHCPPYEIMDKTGSGSHIGSKTLLTRVMEIKPKIVVFGHNHNGYGIVEKNGIKFINCSLLNEEYKMTNKPIYQEIKL